MLFPLILATLSLTTNAQNFYASASQVKTLDGSTITLDDVFSNSEGTILIFWEMNSPNCCNNLENLNQAWLEKVKGLNVDLIAICIDRQGNWSGVKPYVAGRGWEFDTYIDSNGDLKRMLGINSMPYTVLLDKDQNIRCSYAGYCFGDEFRICDKIINCLEKTGDLANL